MIPFPGDTPYVTQVGGTTLTTTGPGGSWVSETVWNRGNGIGSGGGISTQYPIPTWQTNVNMTANHGSTTKRNVPDVALTAENVYVRADGVNYTVGGTSCAAPLWAGFTALINQQAVLQGAPPVGFLNPTVYTIGLGSKYGSSFHDTITGNNTSGSSPTNFYAVVGYDLCTGWGTPAGSNLISAVLAPIVNPLLSIVGSTVTGGNGNGMIDPNECDFLYLSVQNYGADTASGCECHREYNHARRCDSSTPVAINRPPARGHSLQHDSFPGQHFPVVRVRRSHRADSGCRVCRRLQYAELHDPEQQCLHHHANQRREHRAGRYRHRQSL